MTKKQRKLIREKELDAACRHANRRAKQLRAVGIGGRVRPSKEAREAHVATRCQGGVIMGWGKHEWTVIVRQDNRKTASRYHVDFWEPEVGGSPHDH